MNPILDPYQHTPMRELTQRLSLASLITDVPEAKLTLSLRTKEVLRYHLNKGQLATAIEILVRDTFAISEAIFPAHSSFKAPPHVSKEIEIIIKGHMYISYVGEVDKCFGPGEIFVCDAGIGHSGFTLDEEVEAIFITIPPTEGLASGTRRY